MVLPIKQLTLNYLQKLELNGEMEGALVMEIVFDHRYEGSLPGWRYKFGELNRCQVGERPDGGEWVDFALA